MMGFPKSAVLTCGMHEGESSSLAERCGEETWRVIRSFRLAGWPLSQRQPYISLVYFKTSTCISVLWP
jgi:hypothetical protein